ncbi:MAG: translation initiation factor IF-3 [Phycisphaerales bacterium]|nr:translation initiation factor IF-3 [Phycisphaerales bacterium]
MKSINQNLRTNDQIRISPIRVINEANEQLGVMPAHEALRMAREAGLDLVEVQPNVRPPVCRIMNYGKWKYTQKKKSKKHHEQLTKEVRLRPKTDTHDREIKLNRAIRFFKKGHKVQFTMQFRGRERFRKEIAFDIFRDLLAFFGQRVKVERPPSMDGRHMIMILSALKDAFADVQVDETEHDEDEDESVDESVGERADELEGELDEATHEPAPARATAEPVAETATEQPAEEEEERA